jgi:predicted ATPase/class 3 adenylate cyclase
MVACPSCGAANEPVRFCGQCGTALPAAGQPGREPHERAGPTAERRLVSVLFADLVGFTALSESRDPDEVRDLLTRYFDTSRQLIERYGGTVEKFIGDAVMAVWGTPVAREDDAERAVRAALDLVQAVQAMGEEVGGSGLQARAGVLTGEAAVNMAAEGQGMVAGDVVNTASRIQSVAVPGTVLVGERTRRASEAAIAYEEAGLHELKGKAEALPLWRALRVVALRGGGQRSTGLESPFVGRDAELRTVKELYHGTAEGRRAHLVSVIGVAGIGKSRLSWEFSKYVDGLLETVRWHRGRCLAYGEGVTYWALAEMVRSRAGILEGEDGGTARGKLHDAVAEYVPDPEESVWVEARLAHLLALEERTAREPEDLFSAWRLFFERIAQRDPVVLVFEDLQWADPSLIDFIDYLVSWARNHPLFVMALARPEVTERFPAWTTSRRSVSTMYLAPLEPEAMRSLLDGLVPGLPDAVQAKILARAEGIPLYAMETVRMLLDRGLLVQEGSVYRPSGPIEELDVPETLHALIAARLDGLPEEERGLIQDAAVLGKTFGVASVAAVAGVDERSLEPLLSSLVRKEVLFVQADPRSPGRGQYGFLQDLVRRVAYETLSRRDRRARHLAFARHLESAWGGDPGEIAELVASHYLDAFHTDPNAPDAWDVKGHARDALVLAGTRSASLAAKREAQGYFEQAADLADDPVQRADLLERAGRMALDAAMFERGRALLDQAIVLYEEQGNQVAGARIEFRRAQAASADGRLEEAEQRLTRALSVLEAGEPGPEFAAVAAELGRIVYFLGDRHRATEYVERALDVAERLNLAEPLSQALNTKALILKAGGRRQEAIVLMRYALQVALEANIPSAAQRGYNNLSSLVGDTGPYGEVEELQTAGLLLGRKLGYRAWAEKFQASRAGMRVFLGRWDEAEADVAELWDDPEMTGLVAVAGELALMAYVYAMRCQDEAAERALNAPVLEADQDVQSDVVLGAGRAFNLRYAGRPEEALRWAGLAISRRPDVGLTGGVVDAYASAADASLDMGDVPRAIEFLAELEGVPAGDTSPFLRTHAARLRGCIAALGGREAEAEESFAEAIREGRDSGLVLHAGMALAERGIWQAEVGRTEDARRSLDEALAIFEPLRAEWWLRRIRAALGEEPGTPDRSHVPDAEAAPA